jgi:hypothetical protein
MSISSYSSMSLGSVYIMFPISIFQFFEVLIAILQISIQCLAALYMLNCFLTDAVMEG